MNKCFVFFIFVYDFSIFYWVHKFEIFTFEPFLSMLVNARTTHRKWLHSSCGGGILYGILFNKGIKYAIYVHELLAQQVRCEVVVWNCSGELIEVEYLRVNHVANVIMESPKELISNLDNDCKEKNVFFGSFMSFFVENIIRDNI